MPVLLRLWFGVPKVRPTRSKGPELINGESFSGALCVVCEICCILSDRCASVVDKLALGCFEIGLDFGVVRIDSSELARPILGLGLR